MKKIDWENELIKHLVLHTDVFGNDIYPIETKSQWIIYNQLCYEQKQIDDSKEIEFEMKKLDKQQIEELEDFWEFIKEKTKQEKTVITLYYDKSAKMYKTIAYYIDKIKDVNETGGVKVGDS